MQNGMSARTALRRMTVLAALATLAITVAAATDRASPAPRERVVVLGGIFAMSGDYSMFGQMERAAMELAIDDVNRQFAQNAAGIRFAAAIEDDQLDPSLAVQKAQAIHARGGRIVIGAQTSAEVAALAPFLERGGLLLVSPSSTAGSLAIAGDNIFRFTPSDSLEAVAISALMWEEGVRVVVPVWRDDPGNAGLAAATRARFPTLGGQVVDGVKYAAAAREFSAVAAALRAQLAPLVRRHGENQVAVYLAGFDEVTTLFTTVDTDPVLGAVRWYGTDAGALPQSLLRDRRAMTFATRVGYPNPIFSLDPDTRAHWTPILQRIRARADQVPEAFDAYALAVYDAVWVAAKAYLTVSADPEVNALKQALVAAAATHFGATGWTVLDAAGDRRYGNYDFWAMRRVNDDPRWTRVASYDTHTGRLTRRDLVP